MWDMKCCHNSVTISVISLILKVLYVPSPFSVTFVYNVNPYVLGVLCVLVLIMYVGMVYVCQDHTMFTTQPVHLLQHASIPSQS